MVSDSADPQLQMVVNLPWIQVADWSISYYLGIDGLSILLVLLTTFLAPLAILSTWTAVEDRVKDFMFVLITYNRRPPDELMERFYCIHVKADTE